MKRLIPLTMMLVGLLIDTDLALAELRWNPFAGDQPQAAELPPPLVADSGGSFDTTRGVGLPSLGLPPITAPQFSLPEMSLPKLPVPKVMLPRVSVPQMVVPTLESLDLPGVRPPGPRVFERLEAGGQRLWSAARAPLGTGSNSNRGSFLPAIRPAKLKTALLKPPKLTKPELHLPTFKAPAAFPTSGSSGTRPDESRNGGSPVTITGWLSQPGPQ